MSLSLKGQSLYRYTIMNGDTVPIVDLPVVEIGGSVLKEPTFRKKRKALAYNRLRKNVIKVYPYAKLASKLLKECEAEIAKNPENRKSEMKMVEKRLKERYGDELKKLTMSQGRILLLLIDRETGNTTFNLVKDLRGGFSATMYQGIALLFSSNLKSEYDPENIEEHQQIETIVQLIEKGLL